MEDLYAAAYPELYARHWWWRARERILLSTIRGLLPRGGPRPRILDIGCGAGLFFDALDPLGQVEGVESDAAAVARAGRWRSHITVGELDATFKPEHPFDLILMLDVLEHVEQPEALLKNGAALLRPGGHILVTVPAFQWLWTAHDEVNHHVRRYTGRELQRSIAAAGLINIQSQYLFQSLVLPKLLIRMREATIGKSSLVPGIPAHTLNTALERWAHLEFRLMGRLPFGTSLMAIARRR